MSSPNPSPSARNIRNILSTRTRWSDAANDASTRLRIDHDPKNGAFGVTLAQRVSSSADNLSAMRRTTYGSELVEIPLATTR